MYQKLYDIGIGHKNQKILDFGTGLVYFQEQCINMEQNLPE
jgi:hypothetical protein